MTEDLSPGIGFRALSKRTEAAESIEAPVYRRMNIPEHLEIGANYARFSPRGNASLVEAVELVSEAITYCRINEVSRLLADVTGLVGFTSPTLLDRFLLAQEWASAAKGAVTFALVVKPDHIDPRHFGVVVATDAGFVAETFTTEREALEWLMKR